MLPDCGSGVGAAGDVGDGVTVGALMTSGSADGFVRTLSWGITYVVRAHK
jgi:hypothetical protein